MKKLLSLILVLGLISVATAGLKISPVGEGTDPMVQFIGENNGIKGIPGFVGIVGSTTDAGFQWHYAGTFRAITGYVLGDDPEMMDDIIAGMQDVSGVVYDIVYFVEFSDGTATPPSTDGLLATWMLNPGDAIYLHDAEDLSLIGSYRVPEPASMLLLGLGGLFLRRK